MSGEEEVGQPRRGETGELPGLLGDGEGLLERREGLDDLLPELSREFLLKRPTLWDMKERLLVKQMTGN